MPAPQAIAHPDEVALSVQDKLAVSQSDQARERGHALLGEEGGSHQLADQVERAAVHHRGALGVHRARQLLRGAAAAAAAQETDGLGRVILLARAARGVVDEHHPPVPVVVPCLRH